MDEISQVLEVRHSRVEVFLLFFSQLRLVSIFVHTVLSCDVSVKLSRFSRANIRVISLTLVNRGDEVVHALTVGSNELFILFPHIDFILCLLYNYKSTTN